jgi:hypothetical protein
VLAADTSKMIRSLLRLVSLAVLSIALTFPLARTAQARPFPERIELPVGFRPEGITIGTRATAYLGSSANGDIYAVNLRTRRRLGRQRRQRTLGTVGRSQDRQPEPPLRCRRAVWHWQGD